MFTRPLRPCHSAGLFGLAVGLLALAPSSGRAQTGTTGTSGTNGTTGATLPGSFVFSNPATSDQGTAGGIGGNGGIAGPLLGNGGNGGTGGGGGTGLVASGTSANITFQSGAFSGGVGGVGGNGTGPSPVGGNGGNGGAGGAGGVGFIASGASDTLTVLGGAFSGGNGGTGGVGAIGANLYRNGGGGTGGFGGDAFDATGAGTNITILGGTFKAGLGGSGGMGDGSNGGNNGNDFSASAGVTASIYGGFFAFEPLGGQGVAPGQSGAAGYAFALNGSNVTVYGTFQTQQFGGIPIVTPQTFTNTRGSFFGLLADNTGPGQEYVFNAFNGGSLTLAPPPAVPEAATTVSFGLLLALGLGGLVVAARKKPTA